MKKNIRVTEASFHTAAACHNKIVEFSRESVDFFERRCSGKSSLSLIAQTDNGSVAGYMIAYDRYGDDSIYCWMTGVIPAFRQRGVLSAMMDYLSSWAQTEGYTSIRIKTRNNRREMLSWLIKNGFDFLAVDKREPLSDSRIELIKQLTDI